MPGLNGFVGDFLVLLGSFKSTFLGTYAYAAFAGLGVILSAVYLLWMYQRVMLGPVREGAVYGGHKLYDITGREIGALIPIVILVVWIGVYPGTFLKKSSWTAKTVVTLMENVQRGFQPRLAEQHHKYPDENK